MQVAGVKAAACQSPAVPPLTHGVRRHPECRGDHRVGVPAHGVQHDAGPQREALFTAPGMCQPAQCAVLNLSCQLSPVQAT